MMHVYILGPSGKLMISNMSRSQHKEFFMFIYLFSLLVRVRVRLKLCLKNKIFTSKNAFYQMLFTPLKMFLIILSNGFFFFFSNKYFKYKIHF